jgi:NADH:ubiquinone oxidoreductase subunit 3 (subunit A)
VGILFLIFDLEIIFLMPWCYSTSTLSVSSQLWMIVFIILLILGLAYEWLKGGLEWC